MKIKHKCLIAFKSLITLGLFSVFTHFSVYAQQNESNAQKFANPFGYTSAPLQNNFDFGIPPNNGFRWTMNLMPVFPINLSKNLSIVNRIVLPVISQSNIYGTTNQTGLGDLLLNTFIFPNTGNIKWGIGPSFYFPSGFPDLLSAKKWAVGPGIMVAEQKRKLLIGAILFHLWSFAGSAERPDFSYTYFQPLAVYTIKNGWGVGATTEIGYNWSKKNTTGSVIITAHKSVIVAGQIANLSLGPKFYFGNYNAPKYGFRATINLIFL